MTRVLLQNLSKIAALEILVKAGSFRAAGVLLHVTQSALSQMVSSLEGIFGTPLLVREGGLVSPTPACIELLKKVAPILRQVEETAHSIMPADSDEPQLGSLDFGSYESLAIQVLPALTRRLRLSFPSIQLSVKIARSGELVQLVRQNALCMALIAEVDTTADLGVYTIGEERLGVYVAAGHALAKSGRHALPHLALGSLAPGKEGYPRYFARYLRLARLPKVNVVSNSFETLRAMAADGAIAAILPTRVACRPHSTGLEELDLGLAANIGTHKIQLIAPKACDQRESRWVATELQRLFVEV